MLNAFSRQMAVEMGLMRNVYDLTENDHRFGHRRTFDRKGFEHDIVRNGFKLIESGESFFKPFDYRYRNHRRGTACRIG